MWITNYYTSNFSHPNPFKIFHFASNPSLRRGPIFDQPEEASSSEKVISNHGVWDEPRKRSQRH